MGNKARLLVNADDFGLHRDINRGILDCIDQGRVQSVSFSPIGRAVDWHKLAELIRHRIRVGLHVTLVGEPWATDKRLFPTWKELMRQILFAGDSVKEMVDAEIRRQFQLCSDNAVDPRTLSHIDSHQHVHVTNPIWRSCLAQAREFGIARIRVPWCPSPRIMKNGVSGFALQTLARRRRAGISSLPCLGLASAGRNTVATFRNELAHTAHAGCPDVELVVHPGVNTPQLESCYANWHFDWSGERNLLLSREFSETVAANDYAFAEPA